MKRLFPGVIIFVVVIQAFSQGNYSHQTYLKLADSLFQYQNYLSSSNYYQKAIKKAEDPGSIMLRLATCFSKMNQPEEAEIWFEKAEKKSVPFSNKDIYEYADILITLQKRTEAEDILAELLKKDPEAAYARFVIDDLHNIEKYYLDSAGWKVSTLSINTEYSEFAPRFYKDGIVYSSAQPKTFLDKKYHWDGSHFLNLFYSKQIVENTFEKPVFFDKDLNSQYHDGPVTFYNGFEQMILNRNHQDSLGDEENTVIERLTLFDAKRISEKEGWLLEELPFIKRPNMYAHPSIDETGNILFFVSNMEGGYGGTDIYRVERIDDKWGTPVNLGPKVNTHKNEVFPYYADSTLYFASNGLGGLGGLDIFKSIYRDSAFTNPVNLGYPINSSADDFSMLVDENHLTGYFSSSRSGNDDLYACKQVKIIIDLLVEVIDSANNQLIDSAEVELITFPESDQQLLSDQNGNVHFSLPNESSFLLVGIKGDLCGMYSGTVDKSSGSVFKTHQLVLTTKPKQQVPVGGVIANNDGILLDGVTISVIEHSSGDTIEALIHKGVFSFLGEKGKDYRIYVRYKDLLPRQELVSIPVGQDEIEKIEIILDESTKIKPVDMLAHVYKSDGGEAVSGARVELITFMGEDRELQSNQEGNVAFTLPEGVAFLLVGSKDDLTGMYSGTVEAESGKEHMTHQLALSSSQPGQVAVAGKITDKDGYMLDEVVILVTDEESEERFEVLVKQGVFSFMGEQGKNYKIEVGHLHPKKSSSITTVSVGDEAIEKLDIVLEEGIRARPVDILAHVYMAEGGDPVSGAKVELITFTDEDRELETDQEGNVSFRLPEGMTFLLIGSKGEHTGMRNGVADKESGVLKLALSSSQPGQVAVAGKITDKDGYMLDEVVILVTDEESEERFEVLVKQGVFSFMGEQGKNYQIEVGHLHPKKGSSITTVSVGDETIEKLDIVLEDAIRARPVDILAHVYMAEGGDPVSGAKVELITFTDEDRELETDPSGNVAFRLPEGMTFLLIGSKGELTGMRNGVADKASGVLKLALSSSQPRQVAVAGKITDKDGYMLDEVVIMVTDEESEERFEVLVKQGVFSFMGEQGKNYQIEVGHLHPKRGSTLTTVSVGDETLEKLDIVLEEAIRARPVDILAHVYMAEGGDPVSGAKVELITFTDEDRELETDQEGNVTFALPEGMTFLLIGRKGELIGMCNGVADKESGVLKLALSSSQPGQVAVAGKITDKDGYMLDEVVILVTDEESEESFEVLVKQGVFSFMGEQGKNYQIEVGHLHPKRGSILTTVTVGDEAIEKLDIVLEEAIGARPVDILAHVYMSEGGDPVSGAKVELLTFTGEDQKLETDQGGNITFTLPEGTAFLLVGTKGDFTGMYNGLAGNDVTHQLALSSSQPGQVAVAGKITDKDGYMLDEVVILVTDEESEESFEVLVKQGVFSFMGEQGKNYQIEVGHLHPKKGSSITIVSVGDEAIEKLDIVLEEGIRARPVDMLANVYMAEGGDPVSGAKVELLTFTGEDRELETDQEGNVTFALPEGMTFLLIGSKGELTGMRNGVADKESGVLKLALSSSQPGQVAVAGKITDKDGYMLDEVVIMVTDEASEERFEVMVKQGVFSFMGEQGKNYKIEVDHLHPKKGSSLATVYVGEEAIEKLDIVLEESIRARPVDILAHVYMAEGRDPVSGAKVELLTFTDEDMELETDPSGNVAFRLPEGTAFLLVGSKDDLTGMYSGTAEAESGKEYMTHPLALSEGKENQVPVAGWVTDKEGYMLDEVVIMVTSEDSEDTIHAIVRKGVFSFIGEKGKKYKISIDSPEEAASVNNILVSFEEKEITKLTLAVDADNDSRNHLMLLDAPLLVKNSFYSSNTKVYNEKDDDKLREKGNDSFGLRSDNTRLQNDQGLYQSDSRTNADTLQAINSGESMDLSPDQTVNASASASLSTIASGSKNGIESEDAISSANENSSNGYSDGGLVNNLNQANENGTAIDETMPGSNNAPTDTEKMIATDSGESLDLSPGQTVDASASVSLSTIASGSKSGIESEDAISSANENSSNGYFDGGLANNLNQSNENGTAIDETVSNSHNSPTDTEKLLATDSGESMDLSSGQIVDASVAASLSTIASGSKNGIESEDAISSVDEHSSNGNPDDGLANSLNQFNEEGTVNNEAVPSSHNSPTDTEKMIATDSGESLDLSPGQTVDASASVSLSTIASGSKSGIELEDAISSANENSSNGYFDGGLANNLNQSNENGTAIDETVSNSHNSPTDTEKLLATDSGESMDLSSGQIVDASVVASLSTIASGSKNGIESEDAISSVDEHSSNGNPDDGLANSLNQFNEDGTVNNEAVPSSHNSPSDTEKLLAADTGEAMDLSPGQTVESSATASLSTIATGSKNGIESEDAISSANENSSNGYSDGGLANNLNQSNENGTAIDETMPGFNNAPNDTEKMIATDSGKSLDLSSDQSVDLPSTASLSTIVSGSKNSIESEDAISSANENLSNGYPDDGLVNNQFNEDGTATDEAVPNSQGDSFTAASMSVMHGSVFRDASSENSDVAKLIALNSDGQSAMYYILSGGTQSEIVEIDGKICIQNQDQNFVIADGTLNDFKNEPQAYLSKLGIKNTEITSLQDIYFDFNSVEIMNRSEAELQKAYKLLNENPQLKLAIGGHADDRGRENYNLKLSMKRAHSVKSYLMKLGLDDSRMVARAFGESNPIIPCQVQNCGEDEHSINRRAELSLNWANETEIVASHTESKKENESSTLKNRLGMSYGEILDSYGETRVEGLVFKISIGAYRFNPNLTFDELQDLGKVEKKLVSGINYYFLAEFYDLQSAETVRKEVIQRGVYDAFISIYHNDKIISFSTFLRLVEDRKQYQTLNK